MSLGLNRQANSSLHSVRPVTAATSNTSSACQQFSGSVIMFESPVRRKCIMKNSRKPRFSQWKSYWMQLIGGNLLIYYPMKAIMFK
jgi:hypothetical protein